MIKTKKLRELFEVKWLMMRQNPGGKSAYLQGYLLGFAGIINILEALDPATKTAVIKIKVGSGEVQARTADFSGVDPAELTPSDAVTALNKAGFKGCSFSVDPETNRLRLAPSAPGARWIQVYGDLAAALNFGNCRYREGKGCYLWASLDGDLKGVAETEEWGENKNIDNESPTGPKVRYTLPGKRGGTQIVVTDRLSSHEAKQMINGGMWLCGDAEKPEVYEPPVASDDSSRLVDVFTFSKLFENHENTEGSEAFIRERMYIGGTGHMARAGGAGSWFDSEYTMTFGTFMGADGKERASPRETDYTQAQYEAMGLSGLIETGWEDAECGIPDEDGFEDPEKYEEGGDTGPEEDDFS